MEIRTTRTGKPQCVRARYQGTKRKDGRWRIVVTLTAANGGKFKKYFYAPSQKEVQVQVRRFLAGNEERRPTSNMSLERFLDSWMEGKTFKAVNTRRSYEGAIRLHIKPRIGRIRLADLMAADVERMCLEVKALGLERTPSLIREILRAALKSALKNNLVAHNIAALADHPGYESRERPKITLAEFKLVLAWEQVPLFKVLWLFLAEVGFRPDEARRLHLSEILIEDDGHWIKLHNAKTKASRKPRPISHALYEELMKIRGTSLFLFANPETGRPYYPRAINERWDTAVKHALNSHEAIARQIEDPEFPLEHRNLYQLRKLFGRRAAKRAPEHVVSALMGHTDSRTTKVFYLDAEREELRASVSLALVGQEDGERKGEKEQNA